MQFQHRRNSDPRGYSWKKPSQDGTRENQSCKRIEDSIQDQGCREFPWICKLLSTFYPELQSYSKAVNELKGKKEWKWDKEH